jgi:intracellular sulfur oxidation DsrE/DsrF family protein
MKNLLQSPSRRSFVGKLAKAAAVGFTSLQAFQNSAHGTTVKLASDPESWFKNAKGSHRIVYDASEPHEGFAFIWSWVFYLTNNETGVADNDMTAMVVLRHNAMPFALEDRLWKKYNLGEVFKVKDNITQKSATRNPYYIPQQGDFPVPGIEGMQKMQSRGAMFCVCNMALKVYSGIVANAGKLDPQEVYKDWVSGVLKDVQIVPSGVWAISRAQEHRFAYCYAGG